MAKVKKQFIVEIEVDEVEVVNKYPNYRFNYSVVSDFIKAQINDLKFISGINMSKDGMKLFGYSIKIKPLK